MATVTNTIDAVTAWVQMNICNKLRLKRPPENEAGATDAGYDYQLVTPLAFALFVPTQDKITTPGGAPIPSICVRLTDGETNHETGEQKLSFDLCISTWDPGTHGRDILQKQIDGSFEPLTGAAADARFEKNGDGWRDAWNAVDVVLREIGNASSIGGVPIDRSVPVRYSPFKDQEAIPDYYPFWFTVVSFQLKQPARPHNDPVDTDDIQKYL